MRRRLTDKLIDSLKPKTKRYLVYDTVVPNLAVRVGKRKTFVVVARFNSRHPSRRSIGSCVSVSLDEARAIARDWQKPRASSARFDAVAETFFAHIGQQRQAFEVKQKVRREFVERWRNKPLASITRRDVLDVIDEVVRRGSPYAAHNLFAYVRRIFNWAIARGMLEHSPCDRLKPSDIIGPKAVRQRVLTDDELRALWSASQRIPYPYGPLWQLLLVTGQRRSEIAHARWREVDTGTALLTVPPERFKSNATHLVPLSPLALRIIATLPRDGDHLFGRINGFAKAKERLDKLMGDVPHFVIHDIRRTVRTRLSALRVPFEVAEMVIGHGRKGLARVYDQHHYVDEMRAALDLWAQRLVEITTDDVALTRQI